MSKQLFSSHPDSSKCPSEKEHKKYINKFNKVSVKKVNEEPPVWFDEKISKESMTEEEEKELESMLKKYE